MLKGGAQVWHFIGQPTAGLQLSDPHQHRGLESAERHIVIVVMLLLLTRPHHGNREGVASRIARMGQALDRRPAGIAEPQQPRDLVECLAGGVVAGLPQESVAAPRVHEQQQRVASRYEQRHERRLCALILQRRPEEVGLHVVDPDKRPIQSVGGGFHPIQAHEQ